MVSLDRLYKPSWFIPSLFSRPKLNVKMLFVEKQWQLDPERSSLVSKNHFTEPIFQENLKEKF